jgi:hypothetical protein
LRLEVVYNKLKSASEKHLHVPFFRETQNCRDKKLLIFFFAFPVSSGKVGEQSSMVRAAKTFFFGITIFLYQIKNPQTHLDVGRQFYVSTNSTVGGSRVWFSTDFDNKIFITHKSSESRILDLTNNGMVNHYLTDVDHGSHCVARHRTASLTYMSD